MRALDFLAFASCFLPCAFSLTGPYSSYPCSGGWTAWYKNAETWFNTMGYNTQAVEWPSENQMIDHVSSHETALFYELAHGGSYSFSSGCVPMYKSEFLFCVTQADIFWKA